MTTCRACQRPTGTKAHVAGWGDGRCYSQSVCTVCGTSKGPLRQIRDEGELELLKERAEKEDADLRESWKAILGPGDMVEG